METASGALTTLGLDLASDMDLAHPVAEALASAQWLTDLLAFLVLDEAGASDEEIAQFLKPIDDARRRLLRAKPVAEAFRAADRPWP